MSPTHTHKNHQGEGKGEIQKEGIECGQTHRSFDIIMEHCFLLSEQMGLTNCDCCKVLFLNYTNIFWHPSRR